MLERSTKILAATAALAIGATFVLPETTSAGDRMVYAETETSTVQPMVLTMDASNSSYTVAPVIVDGKVKFVSTVN